MRPLHERDLDRGWVVRLPPDPHLRFDTNGCSLDPNLVGRWVEVRVSQRAITSVALDAGELACRHKRMFAKNRTVTTPSTLGRSEPAGATPRSCRDPAREPTQRGAVGCRAHCARVSRRAGSVPVRRGSFRSNGAKGRTSGEKVSSSSSGIANPDGRAHKRTESDS